MLHYEVAPEKLQPFVPFELDVRDGKAYVSLVAFTMRGLRPARGGWLAALPFKPIATHELLNVRTYVKHRGESGIYFLAEWIPNLLSVPLGPPVFGLPYQWGKIDYLHEHERGFAFGEVRARSGRGRLRYRAKVAGGFAPCAAGSLAEWLMERYTAFTEWRGWKRCFRVQARAVAPVRRGCRGDRGLPAGARGLMGSIRALHRRELLAGRSPGADEPARQRQGGKSQITNDS